MLNMDIAKLCQAKTLLGGSDSLIITIGPNRAKPSRPKRVPMAILECYLQLFDVSGELNQPPFIIFCGRLHF